MADGEEGNRIRERRKQLLRQLSYLGVMEKRSVILKARIFSITHVNIDLSDKINNMISPITFSTTPK